jgi:hypothetical protein
MTLPERRCSTRSTPSSLTARPWVLVGAQAIHLHTGDADLTVAEYTTDADFSVSPGELADSPLLGDLLTAHGFLPREHPGVAVP